MHFFGGYIMNQNSLYEKPVSRLLFTTAWPIMLSMILQAMYNLADMFFIARYSEEAAAAVSLTFSIQEVQIAVSVGIGIGISAMVSQSLGSRNPEAASRAAGTGIIMEFLACLPFVCIGIFKTDWFFRLYIQDKTLIPYGTDYLNLCLSLSGGLFLSACTQRILQAAGYTKKSMAVMLIGALVNLIADPILIFGSSVLPAMGTAGAAYATVGGQWISAAVGLYMVFHLIEFKPSLKLYPKSARAIAGIGLPSMLTMLCGSVMVFLMNYLLRTEAYGVIAFYGIWSKLSSVFIMAANGMGQAVLPLTGWAFGARNSDRLNEIKAVSLKASMAFGIFCTLFPLLFARPIMNAFHLSTEASAFGTSAVRILALSWPAASFSIITGYLFAGMRDGMCSLHLALLRQIVFLFPAALLFRHFFGISGVFFAVVSAEYAALVYAVRKNKTISGFPN